MTEEETFRKLKQTPLKELIEIIRSYNEPLRIKEFTSIIQAHGWEYLEYRAAYSEYKLKQTTVRP